MICLPISKEQAPQLAVSRDRPFWTWKKVALVAATILAATAAIGFTTGCLPIPVVIGCAAGSAALFTGVAVAVLIEKIKKRQVEPLTPELLTFLVRGHSLGLRCVSSRERAENEKQNGATGDSLNLDPSVSEVWKDFCPNDRPNENGYGHFQLEQNWKQVPDSGKIEVMRRWEKGVDAFIRDQLLYFHEAPPAFLLVRYTGEADAYDFERYGHGLGKRGRKWIANNNMLRIIPPSDDASLTVDERVRYYRSALIKAVRAESERCGPLFDRWKK